MKKLLPLLLVLFLLTGCVQTYDGPVEQVKVLTRFEMEYIPFEDSDPTTYRTEYAYDIYGNRARVLQYQGSSLRTERRLRFDEAGQAISETVIDHSGRFSWITDRIETAYDHQGRITLRRVRNFWGLIQDEAAYRYDDAAGTLTTTYTSDGVEETFTIRTIRDQEGRDIKTIHSDGTEHRYFYDEAGNQTRWEEWQGETLVSWEAMEYDDRGRVIHRTYCDSTGQESHYTLSYEDHDDGSYTITQSYNHGGYRQEDFTADGEPLGMKDVAADGHISIEHRYYYDYIEVPADKEE